MSGDFVEDAKAEISGMAKQGLRHPSTSPVLAGAAAGALAGAFLPVVTLVSGALIGAAVVFYKRVRP